MIPAKKVLKPQLKGDTFNGVRFTLSPTTDLTGATIRTQFKKSKTSKSALSWEIFARQQTLQNTQMLMAH